MTGTARRSSSSRPRWATQACGWSAAASRSRTSTARGSAAPGGRASSGALPTPPPPESACPHSLATLTALEGEPRGIWAFLGSDRLAAPLLERRPQVVLHGHAHAGAFHGAAGDVPVYNVAVPVLGSDFFVFELDAEGV